MSDRFDMVVPGVEQSLWTGSRLTSAERDEAVDALIAALNARAIRDGLITDTGVGCERVLVLGRATACSATPQPATASEINNNRRDDRWEPLCGLIINDTDEESGMTHHASVCRGCGAVVLDGLRDRHQQWHQDRTSP